MVREGEGLLFPQDRSLGGRLPAKLLEYMAAGRPIVATDVDESFPLKESGAGLVVPVSADHMAEAIVRILNDETVLREMVKKGVQYATKFDWNYVVGRYMEIFQQIASEMHSR